jgi:transcriptional regulator with XRE-family HTH domain
MAGFIDPSSGAEGREEALHRFVRGRRLRLAPESPFLGESARLPNRVGKPVTQEELAEHLGISRGWYSRFEVGSPVEFSVPLLNRLGDILLLSSAERAELMGLAVPELAPVVSGESGALYEALRDVREMVKRLWAATSEAEIFHLAGEEARRLLPDCDLVWVQRGLEAARDEALLFAYPERTCAARLYEVRADAVRRFTPEQLAKMQALAQRNAAGDIQSFETFPPDIRRVVDIVLREHGLHSHSLLGAHIGGPREPALVGGISTRPHEVTELQRSILSAVADFTSLALH